MLFSYYLCLPITLALSILHFVSPLCELSRPEFCLSRVFPKFSVSLVLIAAFCRTSFSCSWFVRFELRMIWCCVRPEDKHFETPFFDLINFGRLFDLRNCWCVRSMSCVWSCVRPEKLLGCVRSEKDFGREFDLRKILVVCATGKRFLSCVRPEKDFGRVFDPRMILVVCSTWERFWSCVRSENVFGRMCELKMILFVCSTWERFWSRVRPEKDIGRVFELRKILVVCWTWECVWSCVLPKHDFGPVFDLRKILVLCSAWQCFWSCVPPEKDFGRMFDLIKIFGRVLDLRMIFQIVCSTLQWSFDRVFDLRMIRMILWSYVDGYRKTDSGRTFDLKRFGLVPDLWQILAVCTTCGRFSFVCSIRQKFKSSVRY